MTSIIQANLMFTHTLFGLVSVTSILCYPPDQEYYYDYDNYYLDLDYSGKNEDFNNIQANILAI